MPAWKSTKWLPYLQIDYLKNELSTQKRLLYAASYGMSFSFKELETCIMGGNVATSAATMITPIQEEEEEEKNIQQQNLEEYKEDEGKAAEVILQDYTNSAATTDNNNNEERPNIYAKKFVSCSKTLRVLNMLRNAEVGLTLTISQYEEITPTGICIICH